MEIVDFIRQRLAEDEAEARDWSAPTSTTEGPGKLGTRWDLVPTYTPARVLRQAAAKRAILNMYVTIATADRLPSAEAYMDGYSTAADIIVRTIATEWSDHLDYRAEWAPEA